MPCQLFSFALQLHIVIFELFYPFRHMEWMYEI